MIQVNSEVGRLRRVVVQAPGPALERVLPEHIVPASSNYLLFDDLVDVSKARQEHDALCSVLSTVAEVIHFETLLVEVLANVQHRDQLIGEVAGLHGLSDADCRELEGLEPERLAAALIVGTADGGLDSRALFDPVPNLIFVRDMAMIVGNLLVVGNASKRARKRETLLTWAVVNHHPMFADAKIASTCRRIQGEGGNARLTVEGGDVLLVSNSMVCIGASERTNWSMIIALAHELLDGGFTRVLVVEMPKQRSSMHLDTVFTMVNWDAGVIYRPLLERGGREEARIVRLRRIGSSTAVEELDCDLLDALALEGHPLQSIVCGGGHPIHSAREQWTDGANYVAIAPGIVIGYARNHRTAREMERFGFEVMNPSMFLSVIEHDFSGDVEALLMSGRRFAVHLVGSELSRGRGGPRCLTWPVERDG